jgi:hypothetical protein
MLDKERIQQMCYRMKPGQCLILDIDSFYEAFPFGWPTVYKNPEEAFLGSMMGTRYGTFRTEKDVIGNFQENLVRLRRG